MKTIVLFILIGVSAMRGAETNLPLDNRPPAPSETTGLGGVVGGELPALSNNTLSELVQKGFIKAGQPVSINGKNFIVSTNALQQYQLLIVPGVVKQSLTTGNSILTNAMPASSKSDLFARSTISLGLGYSTGIKSPVEYLALNTSIYKDLSVGAVAYHDKFGFEAAAFTFNITGTMRLPVVGELTCFAGDGPGWDFYVHRPMNYLFVGAEKDFTIWGQDLSTGIVIANTSSRPGTEIFLSQTWRF